MFVASSRVDERSLIAADVPRNSVDAVSGPVPPATVARLRALSVRAPLAPVGARLVVARDKVELPTVDGVARVFGVAHADPPTNFDSASARNVAWGVGGPFGVVRASLLIRKVVLVENF